MRMVLLQKPARQSQPQTQTIPTTIPPPTIPHQTIHIQRGEAAAAEEEEEVVEVEVVEEEEDWEAEVCMITYIDLTIRRNI